MRLLPPSVYCTFVIINDHFALRWMEEQNTFRVILWQYKGLLVVVLPPNYSTFFSSDNEMSKVKIIFSSWICRFHQWWLKYLDLCNLTYWSFWTLLEKDVFYIFSEANLRWLSSLIFISNILHIYHNCILLLINIYSYLTVNRI